MTRLRHLVLWLEISHWLFYQIRRILNITENKNKNKALFAEYRSMASTTCEVIWLTGLFKDLGVEDLVPVNLYCDNRAVIHIYSNTVFHERTLKNKKRSITLSSWDRATIVVLAAPRRTRFFHGTCYMHSYVNENTKWILTSYTLKKTTALRCFGFQIILHFIRGIW